MDAGYVFGLVGSEVEMCIRVQGRLTATVKAQHQNYDSRSALEQFKSQIINLKSMKWKCTFEAFSVSR